MIASYAKTVSRNNTIEDLEHDDSRSADLYENQFGEKKRGKPNTSVKIHGDDITIIHNKGIEKEENFIDSK
jgi:hypothetical protein